MAEEQENVVEALEVTETTEAAAASLNVAASPVVSIHSRLTADRISQPEDAASTQAHIRINESVSYRSIQTNAESVEEPEEIVEAEPTAEEIQLRQKQERKERMKQLLMRGSGPFGDNISTEKLQNVENLQGDCTFEDPAEIVLHFNDMGEEEDEGTSIGSVGKSSIVNADLANMVSILPPLPYLNVDDVDVFDRSHMLDYDGALSRVESMISPPKSMHDDDSVYQKALFLRNFELPSLSDISEEQSEEIIPVLKRLKSQTSGIATPKDQGSFVNPLTGAILYDSSSSDSSSNFDLPEDNMRDPESDLSISIAMSDIIDVKPAPPEPPKSSIITFDEFSVKLKDMDLHEEDDDEDPVYLHAIEVERVVYDFVQELLLEVMEGSDNRNAENIRRDRLDKTKLFEELRQTANAYMIEKSTNVLLNNRINEYYKRGRNTRVFAKLSAFDESRFYNRYMYALTLVDRLKDRVEQAKFQQSCTLNKVFFDLHSSQMVTTIMEERLEKKVRRTLLRPDMEHLPRFVDREIRLMNAKRREISDTRLGLITRKHTLGHILNKIKELETVGINNFIAIQNEVVAVEKKIEERSADLKRLRQQYLTELHLTMHNREKALAIADTLKAKKKSLLKYEEHQRQLRNRLYEAKLERTRLHKKQKDLAYQGGILSMPSLMREYDDTVDRLKEKREKVMKLRESVNAMNRRLTTYDQEQGL